MVQSCDAFVVEVLFLLKLVQDLGNIIRTPTLVNCMVYTVRPFERDINSTGPQHACAMVDARHEQNEKAQGEVADYNEGYSPRAR